MISLEEIIDKWLGENHYDYWVWSIPSEAYPLWPMRSYIISNDEVLLATITDRAITPTVAFENIIDEILICDPQLFKKLEYFMGVATKKHNARRNQ